MIRPCVAFAFAFLACTVCLGAQQKVPLTSAEEVGNYVESTAVVEFTVLEVKHPQRRKAMFLSSTANFRSPQSISVLIRDADLHHFSTNGIESLSAMYTGNRIRVQGEIARDEGQLVVRITAREQLEIVESATKAVNGNDIVVTNEGGQARRVSADELAKLPQESLQVEHEGKQLTYSGVSLSTVLGHAGVVLGEEARGRYLNRYVIVSASDGYQALFSIGEIDPYLSKQTILLADECDGKPLSTAEGSLRLIVGNDVRHRRWIRSVAKIEIRYAVAAEGVSARD